MPLGKRKIGCDDVSSEVDAIQELMTDMELACNEQDHVAVELIYERYLTQTEKVAASKCFVEDDCMNSKTGCRLMPQSRRFDCSFLMTTGGLMHHGKAKRARPF